MNLALEKGERITTGCKGRGEIGGEAGEVTGVVADVPTTNGELIYCINIVLIFWGLLIYRFICKLAGIYYILSVVNIQSLWVHAQ